MEKRKKTAIILCVCILSGCAARQPQRKIPADIPANVRTEIKTLYSPDASERGEAIIRLGFMGEKASAAIPFLLDMLNDARVLHSPVLGYTSPGKLSAEALIDIGGNNIADTLLVILNSEDKEAGANAAVALGKLGDTRAVEPLIVALKNKNDYIRGRVARALGKIGEPSVDPLITSLKDEAPYVRATAARTLGEIGDARAVEPLVVALSDSNADVQEKSAEALDSLNWKPKNQEQKISYLLATIKTRSRKSGIVSTPVRGEWSALIKIGQPAVEPIIKKLKDEDSGIRTGAAWALGQIGDARAVGPLINALKDQNSDVRGYAAYALGNISDSHPVESLIAALKDKESLVRGNAAYALGEIGDFCAVEPLIFLLNDDKSFVQGRALEALQKITNKYFEKDQEKWQAWWNKNKNEIK